MLSRVGGVAGRALAGWGRGWARTYTSGSPTPYTVPAGAWGANRGARLELAAAYRGLDMLGLNEGVCNHLTVMAPRADGAGRTMLVVDYGLHWSEVTASGLLGLSEESAVVEGSGRPDVTAACIHLGIRQVRPDATVIMHTHQPHATAIACLKDPSLLMLHQNSARFFQRVAYDQDYSGLAMAMDEGRRLGHKLGDKDVLFMGNHGVLCVAPTIAVAFDNLYYLERAAQVQVMALAMQKEMALLSDEEAASTSDTIWRDLQHYADSHFFSTYRRLRKTQPDFEL